MSGIVEKVALRLDLEMVKRGLGRSRRECQEYIERRAVTVNGVVVTKPAQMVSESDIIAVIGASNGYVSRAGEKLACALDTFGVSVEGMVVLDAGLSTGGFTDCLLQRGAARVYGVDVGTGQVDGRIAADSRVVVMEKTNLRTLESLPERVDLITLDLSFISLTKIIPLLDRFARTPDDTGASTTQGESCATAPSVDEPAGSGASCVRDNGRRTVLVTLIKPQFEVGREGVGRNGLVTSEKLITQACVDVVAYARAYGWEQRGAVIESPLRGAGSGNREYLACFVKVSVANVEYVAECDEE